MKECFDKIKQVRKDLTDVEIDDILNATEKQLKDIRLKQQTEISYTETGKRIKKNMREAFLIQKRNAAINVVRYNELMSNVARFMEDTGIRDPGEALKTMMVGTHHKGFESRLSVDARQKAISAEFVGELVARLRKKDYLDIVSTKELDDDIATELYAIGHGEKKPATKNKQAREIAEILKDMQRKMVKRENDAGAWIKETPDYIIKQGHDTSKMSKAGLDKWREDIKPLLNMKRMKAEWNVDADTIDDFLEAVFDNLTIGREFKFANTSSKNPLGIAFQGPGNLAKKMSAERVLHFKDAVSYMAYHNDYSRGGIIENVLMAMEDGGHRIGLMETWGTNPEYMFDRIRKEWANKFRKDEKVYKRLTGKKFFDTNDWYFGEISGRNRQVGNVTAAQISSSIRSVQSMAKLGGATISSFSDVVSQAAELKHHGIGFLERHSNSLKSISKGMSKEEVKEVYDYIGLGMHGILGDVHTRVSGVDTMPGTMSKILHSYFKLNLLTQWTDAMKTGVARILSHNLARNKSVAFKSLPDELQKMLKFSDIQEADWNLIRKHTVGKFDGTDYVTTNGIRDIDIGSLKNALAKRKNVAVSEITDKMAEKYGRDLERNVRSYFIEAADTATPTPGAKERAMMNMGSLRGTPLGEAVRFVMQFKSFPITYLTKSISREIYGNASKKQATWRIMNMVVGMTAMGYVSKAVKDLAVGKEPLNPNDASTWIASALQGGGLGIFGDFALQEYSRYGSSFWGTALGPTASTVEGMFDVYGQVQKVLAGDADFGDVGEEAFKLGKYNTPGLNLFYTRLALDYMFLWSIQESMNPGFAVRLESKALDDNREYFIKPTERVN